MESQSEWKKTGNPPRVFRDMGIFNGSILAWVVHGEINNVPVLTECRAQAVLHKPGAVNVHCVTLPHASPLWVRV